MSSGLTNSDNEDMIVTGSPYFSYCGDEFELFGEAKNWKRYFSEFLNRYIAGDVAEEGAGVGGTTGFLLNPRVKSWLCIESDLNQASAISDKIKAGVLPESCRVKVGVSVGFALSLANRLRLKIEIASGEPSRFLGSLDCSTIPLPTKPFRGGLVVALLLFGAVVRQRVTLSVQPIHRHEG